MESDDDPTLNVTSDLSKLGLSSLESRIYVYILRRGQVKASEVSKSLGVNRVDIYRSIKGLRQRGILEVVLSRPLLFSAITPPMLRKTLVEEQEQKLQAFKQLAIEIQESLSLISKIESAEKQLVHETEHERFTIKTGRQIIEKWRQMAINSRQDIAIILSAIGVKTHYTEGFVELYSKLSKKKVRVRIIAEVRKDNLDEVIEFSKVCQVKILAHPSSTLRYVISDDSELMVSAGSFSNDQRDFVAIETSKDALIRALKGDFDEKWKKAKVFSKDQILNSIW